MSREVRLGQLIPTNVFVSDTTEGTTPWAATQKLPSEKKAASPGKESGGTELNYN